MLFPFVKLIENTEVFGIEAEGFYKSTIVIRINTSTFYISTYL